MRIGEIYFYQMKSILIFIIIVFNIQLYSQNKISGEYNYHSYTVNIYEDSTFHFEYHFDLIADIGHGNYKIVNDTILLNYKRLFDTISYYDTINYDDNKISGKLNKIVLVVNDSADLKYVDSDFTGICCGIGTVDRFPKKLYYKRDKLYFIKKNGKLNYRKGINIYGKKIKPPFFKKA